MTTTNFSPVATSLLVALGLSFSACSVRPNLTESTNPVAATASPSNPVTADDHLPLAERLAREASSRPSSGPRVEAVAAALTRSGAGLGPLRQVLGRTIGARFCMAGQTAPGLGVSICEFRDAPDAARGLAMSRQTFDRLIPNRRLERNRGTVLTLTRPSVNPDLDAEAARLAHLFASL